MEPAGARRHRRARRDPGRDRRAGRGLAAAAHDRARDRLLDRRGPVGRDRRPPARATSRSRCARTARRRCTTCCCTSGSTSRAAREAGVRGLSLLFALLAIPAVVLGRARSIWGTIKAAWFAAVLMAFNPFLAQYAQEARMYSLVALLAIPATTCFIRAYALDAPSRDGPGSPASRSRSRSRSTPTTGRSSSRSRAARRLGAAVAARRASRAAASCCATACWASAALFVLYLPWVPTTLYQAAHTGAPWADAPALGLAARRARRAARADAADRAADLRRRGPARARQAPRLERARPRGRCAGDHRRAHADDRVDAVAGLARLGQPLPRRRAAAVPAARRGRAGERAPARARRARAGRDHVGAGRRAGREEQRPRDRPRDRARASRPATW